MNPSGDENQSADAAHHFWPFQSRFEVDKRLARKPTKTSAGKDPTKSKTVDLVLDNIGFVLAPFNHYEVVCFKNCVSQYIDALLLVVQVWVKLKTILFQMQHFNQAL